MSKAWSGAVVAKARAGWKSRLPLPCWLCKRPVTGLEAWVVEHIVPRSLGGDALGVSNQWVSHRSCSDKQGGQMGAAKTNARKSSNRIEDQRLRPW